MKNKLVCRLGQKLLNCSSSQYNLKQVAAFYQISGRFKATSASTCSSTEFDLGGGGNENIREKIAPWIRIGDFKSGLLSHLSTGDIIRALFVLRVCSVDWIVERSLPVFELAIKLGPLAKWPIRKTFFNQFVGGEEVSRMTTVVRSLQHRGLRLMVAPVLEEDLLEKSSKKTYEVNMKTLLELADMTSSLEKNRPILQLKVSAITPPAALDEISRAILQHCGDNEEKQARLIEELVHTIDNPSAFTTLSKTVSKENQSYFIDGLRLADQLAKRAQDLSLNITVDAEFYSCKPAISFTALALMAKYNGGQGNLIGNTIQGYLKDAVPTIQSELKVMTKLVGVNWYGKIVRGAYMDRERQVRRMEGKPSVICDTYEDTSNSYNRCVTLLLNQIAREKKEGRGNSHVLVATHNEKSIRLAAEQMRQLDIDPAEGRVAFGQIYGMADYLSTPLVEKGYTVYKSTPYGPMEKVIPYLTRRALENRSVIQGAREERLMLSKELWHRLKLSK